VSSIDWGDWVKVDLEDCKDGSNPLRGEGELFRWETRTQRFGAALWCSTIGKSLVADMYSWDST